MRLCPRRHPPLSLSMNVHRFLLRSGQSRHAGRENEPFSIYLAVRAFPDLDLYRRLEDAGVTDLLCAPWMAVRAEDGDTPESIRAARLGVCEQFAEHFVAPMG